jgi:hypothetical protein
MTTGEHRDYMSTLQPSEARPSLPKCDQCKLEEVCFLSYLFSPRAFIVCLFFLSLRVLLVQMASLFLSNRVQAVKLPVIVLWIVRKRLGMVTKNSVVLFLHTTTTRTPRQLPKTPQSLPPLLLRNPDFSSLPPFFISVSLSFVCLGLASNSSRFHLITVVAFMYANAT